MKKSLLLSIITIGFLLSGCDSKSSIDEAYIMGMEKAYQTEEISNYSNLPKFKPGIMLDYSIRVLGCVHDKDILLVKEINIKAESKELADQIVKALSEEETNSLDVFEKTMIEKL